MLKNFSNIKSWVKRNIFVVSLNPRIVLLFSMMAIVLACLPLVLSYLVINEWMAGLYIYHDTVELSTKALLAILVVCLLCLSVIVYSVYRIVVISLAYYRKRKRAKKLRP